MNKIRFSFIIAVLALAVNGLHAQTSIQTLTFSLLGSYQTNTTTTNFSHGVPVSTNNNSIIHAISISTANVVRAIQVDLDPTNLALWSGATLVREVNLSNGAAGGAEGIFLRKGTNQTNVSSFFDVSFTNNFTGFLGGYMPLVTNGFATSFADASSGSFPPNAALLGGKIVVGPTNNITNYLASAGLYTLSLFTSNLQFNLFGIGSGTIANVSGRINGTNYERQIYSEAIGTAGAFYLNITSNIFDMGAVPPAYIGGPLHGGISTSAGKFYDIAGP